jgi:general secretion pathway protein G
MFFNAQSDQRRRQGGFSLIEILIVIVIIGILAGLVVVNVMDRPDQARVVAARNDINGLQNALKLYRLDNGSYPPADVGLEALVKRPASATNWKPGGYVERLSKDPWGHDYQYLNPGVRGEIDVFSFGRDGKAGGEGFDADIFP